MKIQNPGCEIDSLYLNKDGSIQTARISAGFEIGDFRYHVWLNPDGSIIKGRRSMARGAPEMQVLFKNPIAHDRKSKTVFLDATAKKNAPLIAELMASISIPLAIELFKKNEQAAQEQAAADWRVAMILETKQAAAEKLFDALIELLALVETFAPYERGELPVVEMAKTALDAATLKVTS